MRFVIDANEIFSFFNKKSKAREIVLISEVPFYAPKFALIEIQKYEKEIMKRFLLNEDQFSFVFDLIGKVIFFVEKEEYEEFIQNAEKVCPDKDDVDYFALALKLNCGIWSEDKELRNQKEVEVLSTKDLITKHKF